MTSDRTKQLTDLLFLWPDEAAILLADTADARTALVAKLQSAFDAECQRRRDGHFAASYGRAHQLQAALKREREALEAFTMQVAA